MRCINKITLVLAAAGIAFMINGCGQKEIPFAYNPNYEVSSYRVVSGKTDLVASSFAENLCVVNSDVNVDDSQVDMSEATAAGLFNVNNKEVLYAKNIHERLQPASLTKIMTALVAIKHGNPDDNIVVTQEAMVSESGAQLCGLKPGDQLTLNQALHAMLIYSANDAAAAIAVHIGGSIQGFAEMMNQEALAIGATNSHFVNPHGLTDDNHYTTAYDLYLIFNAAFAQSELISEIIHMTSYETVIMDKDGKSKTISVHTTNQFLSGNYKAPEQVTVIGGKTGTTLAAGNCLILLTKDTAGSPYISVILKSLQRDIMYGEMTDLLDEIP